MPIENRLGANNAHEPFLVSYQPPEKFTIRRNSITLASKPKVPNLPTPQSALNPVVPGEAGIHALQPN